MKKILSIGLSTINGTLCILLLLVVFTTNIAKGQTMSRQDKLFIQKGIQFPSWVRNDHASEQVVVPTRQKISIGRTGRYVRLQLSNTQILSIAELQVFSGGVNIALSKTTQQSSNKGSGGLSNLAVDGNTNGDYAGNSVTHTLEGYAQMEPWWQVDLNSVSSIDSIVIWNRTDCCGQRMKGYYLLVSDNVYSGTTLASSMAQSGVSHYVQPITAIATHIPTATELNNAYITPTYFEIPNYNYEVHQQDPNMWWGMAKGAKPAFPAGVIDRGPSTFEQSNGFLNSLQAANINKAYSFCIGDEEPYSTTNTGYVKGWFDIIKAKYPNVLMHTNQYANQWNYTQMKTYMQTTQPDLITFDMYYYNYVFGGPGANAGNTYTRMYRDMATYRSWALGGYDGSGNAPIPFGGYVQAFSGDSPGTYANYRPSESEINLNTYAYLTLGAKWVNVWIYFALFWNGTSVTPQYHQFAKVGKELSKLSPHLSRLRTTDVRFIPGQNTSGTNVSPNNVAAWTATLDPYVTGITATNLGTFNNGLKGDVLVGYFKPVPGIANTAGITMAPVVNKDTKYFMILNGLTKPNGPGNNSVDTVQGKANLVRQKITLNINFGTYPNDTLYRVNRNTGVAEMMNLTLVSGSQYTLTDTLDGGVADLFYWKNQGLPPAEPTTGTSLKLSSGYSSAGNITQLNGANKFTLETWVKFNSNTPWNSIFFRYGSSTNRIVLSTNDANGLHVVVSNGQTNYANSPNNVIVPNQWYHLAVVYDGTQSTDANKLKLFIYAQQQTLTFGGAVPSTAGTTSAPLVIGAKDLTSGTNYLDGVVDEVRVWDTVLSQSELLSWKDKTLGSCHPKSANLTLYWGLNDSSSSTTAVAGLGTSYTGTISNGTYQTLGQANNLSGCTGGMMAVDKKQNIAINEVNDSADKVTAYPNPVDGQLNLYIYQNAASNSTISVFNSVGQKIYQIKKQLIKGANEIAIDFGTQTPGLYIVQVKDAQGEKQLKVIKK